MSSCDITINFVGSKNVRKVSSFAWYILCFIHTMLEGPTEYVNARRM
jgi:hypothetical protein